MKTLIVEDDFVSRMLMTEMLKSYGPCHIAVNGVEAVQAFSAALENEAPYELVCLDIMMPEMDGHAALAAIRKIEEDAGIVLGKGVKVIMTTALSDKSSIMNAFKFQCDAYIVKPVDRTSMLAQLKNLGLTE